MKRKISDAEKNYCGYCGRELEDNQKDFCSEYCKYMDLWAEYCKKKYGTAKCVICGEEIIKESPMDEICESEECQAKQNRLLNIKKRMLEEGVIPTDITLEDEADICSNVTAREDIFENVVAEKDLLLEIEDDNYNLQRDCVPNVTQSEEIQEDLTEVPQESEVNCEICGKTIGKLIGGSQEIYSFCSKVCLEFCEHYGRYSKNYGVAKCSHCGKEFLKHYKNQKQCYDCGHKNRYW